MSAHYTTEKSLAFGPMIQFKTLADDKRLMIAAAKEKGMTLSAFIRLSALEAALKVLNCATRSEGLLKLNPPPAPQGHLDAARTRRRSVG